MSFFSNIPAPEPEADDSAEFRAPAWFVPSEDEVPVAVHIGRVLAEQPGVTFVLQRADVYSQGIQFVFLTAVRATSALSRAEFTTLYEAASGSFRSNDPRRDLRIGLTLADGARLDSYRGDNGLDWEHAPSGPVFSLGGGGAHGGSHRMSVHSTGWLWPLPAPGQATLHFSYPGLGVDEGSIDIDLPPLVDAAAGVVFIESPC